MLIIIDVQNNCLHEIMFDQTVERAQELDDYFIKHNSTCGPLHGLPIRLKDQFYVKGVETTMGYIGWIDTYEGDTVGCTNRIKRLSVGINDWILTEDLSTNK
jgi:Asp-tRNA(Asn)/Glu-tRNA(Gln) amidotransferase A subunit family amidase